MEKISVLFFCKRLLNLIIVLCFVTPALVSYWRGTWHILDLFMFPDRKLLSAWVTLAVSFGTIYMMVLVGDYLKAFLNRRAAKKGLYLALFYPLGILIVNSWRGLWLLWDHYTTVSLTSGCVSHAAGFFIVLLTQTTSSIAAPPSYCARDKNDNELQSIFQVKVWLNNSWVDILSRILNSFCTVFITGVAVISYWRGTWVVMDALTMSQERDKLLSSIISISAGCFVFTICYIVCEFISNTKELKPSFSWRSRAFEQVYVYLLGFATVNCWRGIWYLEDIYLLPDRPEASALVGHFVGVVILYVLQASLNLVCPPAYCRYHGSEWLEGLDLGSFLEKSPEPEEAEKNLDNLGQIKN